MLKLGGWEPLARSVLRMVVGFTFSLHGFQKLLGLFGGRGPRALSFTWVGRPITSTMRECAWPNTLTPNCLTETKFTK